RERTDDTTVRIATLGQELEALRSSIPVAPAPVATATEPVDPNAPPGTTPPPAPAVPSTAGLSPTRMYETSFADYTAGQYSLAIPAGAPNRIWIGWAGNPAASDLPCHSGPIT